MFSVSSRENLFDVGSPDRHDVTVRIRKWVTDGLFSYLNPMLDLTIPLSL